MPRPVTAAVRDELAAALVAGSEQVRGSGSDEGHGPGSDEAQRRDLGWHRRDGIPDRAGATLTPPDPVALARAAQETGEIDLPAVLALIEALPRDRSARLLVDFFAAFSAPRD